MDELDALRRRLVDCRGRDRLGPLDALGRALLRRHRRVGHHDPRAAPLVDEAVTVHEEMLGLTGPGEPGQDAVAVRLGWCLALRHTAHGGGAQDGPRAEALLTAALSADRLPPATTTGARLLTALLNLTRVLAGLADPAALSRLITGGSQTELRACLARATGALHDVRDAPVTAAGTDGAARTMLAAVGAVEEMLDMIGGGSGGMDMARIAQIAHRLAALRADTAPGAVWGTVDVEELLGSDVTGTTASGTGPDGAATGRTAPGDRPSAVPRWASPPPPAPPAPDPAAAATPLPPAAREDPQTGPSPAGPVPARTRASARPGADATRAALLRLLPGRSPLGVLTLLDPAAHDPHHARIDELVALAVVVAEGPGAGPTDRLLGAAALWLRADADPGGGWGVRTRRTDGGDLHTARDHLLACADAIGAGDQATVALAARLTDLLAPQLPGAHLRARLAAGFAPTVRALRSTGADGLLYRGEGGSLLLAVDGRLRPVATDDELPHRLVAVGADPPADRCGSRVTCGAQLVELATRRPDQVTRDPLFVVDPRGDRPRAALDALLLRRSFHPHSRALGSAAEQPAGPGTATEVRAALPASLAHLDCGVAGDGALELAGGGTLSPATIRSALPPGGGTAVLARNGPGGDALVDALLARSFRTVVRVRGTPPDRVGTLIQLMLHRELVEHRCGGPEAALRVRRWLADPDRRAPEHLPPWVWADAASDLTGHADSVVVHGV